MFIFISYARVTSKRGWQNCTSAVTERLKIVAVDRDGLSLQMVILRNKSFLFRRKTDI